jgi:Glycosyltransferase GT-D fold
VTYPQVWDEVATIDKLVAGKYRGMARFGDGDFNVLRGQEDRFHKACPKLAQALAESIHRGSNQVLNCLIPPPLDAREGALAFARWHFYLEMNAGLFPFLRDEVYGSSNISRMDSCPHLHTTSWWDHVAKLWAGKRICLVRGTDRSLTTTKLMESPGAPTSVTEVICKPRDNFGELNDIHARVRAAGCETVVLCSGLTTRPLVHQLVRDGHIAYDMGHFGQWFNKGRPIPMTDVPR